MFIKRLPVSIKWFTIGSLGIGGIYTYDNHTEAKLIQRNIRTFYNGIALAIDYKVHGGDKNNLAALHDRVANCIFDVFEHGQVIATQSAVLPAAYQRRARKLLDDAPAIPESSIQQVFLEEFGVLPQDIFLSFSSQPVASASIAQVHKATLPTGQVVAVKVQKPAVRKQMEWDLRAFRILLHLYEYVFELPLTFAAGYIESHIRQEVDFENEARNGERAMQNLSQLSQLKNKVHIPKIYPEYSSKRILVCEWVDGVKLTDTNKIESLGLDYKEAMKIAIEAFASQIFISGFVHGDPHAGNVLVRNNPNNKKKVQVVLVDHGLYVEESSKFRLQYCKLWQAIFMLDLKTLSNVCSEWGIHDVDMFASITLQKPFVPDKAVHIQQTSLHDIYQYQTDMKARLKNFLENQEQFPRELIFLSRNMEIVRGNNKLVGSPVNRINIMAKWAVRGIDDNQKRVFESKGQWLRYKIQSTLRRLIFNMTLIVMSVSFWIIKFRQATSKTLLGKPSLGFEDLVDQRMKEQMYLQYGIEVDENMFDA
ncbi:unnamed protein product [Cunninghamella blakesleeana]